MQKQPINPMGWARMPALKGDFGSRSSKSQAAQDKLTQILVKQMGIAEGVYLVNDPETGNVVMDIHLYPNRSAALPELLVQQEINGLPVRYSLVK